MEIIPTEREIVYYEVVPKERTVTSVMIVFSVCEAPRETCHFLMEHFAAACSCRPSIEKAYATNRRSLIFFVCLVPLPSLHATVCPSFYGVPALHYHMQDRVKENVREFTSQVPQLVERYVFKSVSRGSWNDGTSGCQLGAAVSHS